MERPVLLDLFCGGGGMSMGYHQAGFEVVGVDSVPQKRYPFRFIQADALGFCERWGERFDALSASPPCQFGTVLSHLYQNDPTYAARHPNLISQTRELLIATKRPYVIENVEGAKKALVNPFTLCGSMFHLRTDCGAELRRHRCFETNWFDDLMEVPLCQHGSERTIGITGTGQPMTGVRKLSIKKTVTGDGHSAMDGKKVISIVGNSPENRAVPRTRTISVTGSTAQQNTERNVVRECFSIEAARVAMGIDWLSMKELSQAIPPAYSKWIGDRLMEYLTTLQSYPASGR